LLIRATSALSSPAVRRSSWHRVPSSVQYLFGDVCTRKKERGGTRADALDEDALAAPARVLAEEALEGEELEGDAAEALAGLDAREDRAARPPGERRVELADRVGRRFVVARGQDHGRLDGDVAHDDHDRAAAVLDARDAALDRLVRHAHEALARVEEVARVVERVEADDVRADDALEEPRPVRERAEELGRGEGDVEEEDDARLALGEVVRAEHGVRVVGQKAREEHEVVVVDPDRVALAQDP